MDEIPESIKDIFDKLDNEVSSLHATWMIFRQLFLRSERRAELLHNCALDDHIQMAINRLADPARLGKHENLSLRLLYERVECLGEKHLASELRELCDQLKEKCEVFKTIRDKRLAHFDLKIALDNNMQRIPDITLEIIDDVLKLISEYMNTIRRHYCRIPRCYENPSMPRDGEALVAMLIRGVRYDELVKEQKISLYDLAKSQWYDA